MVGIKYLHHSVLYSRLEKRRALLLSSYWNLMRHRISLQAPFQMNSLFSKWTCLNLHMDRHLKITDRVWIKSQSFHSILQRSIFSLAIRLQVELQDLINVLPAQAMLRSIISLIPLKMKQAPLFSNNSLIQQSLVEKAPNYSSKHRQSPTLKLTTQMQMVLNMNGQ